MGYDCFHHTISPIYLIAKIRESILVYKSFIGLNSTKYIKYLSALTYSNGDLVSREETSSRIGSKQ